MKKITTLVLAGLLLNVAAFAAPGPNKGPTNCADVMEKLRQAKKEASSSQASPASDAKKPAAESAQ